MPIEKSPEKNAILFVWFNHYAGILLKTPSKTLVIDPVDVKPRQLQNTDAILITHEHYDHLDQRLIAETQKNTNCQIIADPTSAQKPQKRHSHPTKFRKSIQAQKPKSAKSPVKAEKCQHPAAPTSHLHHHQRRRRKNLPHRRLRTLPRNGQTSAKKKNSTSPSAQ